MALLEVGDVKQLVLIFVPHVTRAYFGSVSVKFGCTRTAGVTVEVAREFGASLRAVPMGGRQELFLRALRSSEHAGAARLGFCVPVGNPPPRIPSLPVTSTDVPTPLQRGQKPHEGSASETNKKTSKT